MNQIWVNDARKRITLQKSLTKKERAILINRVNTKSPFELGRSGIYLTPNPLLVVLGISPGNSKSNKVREVVPMEFGKPHVKLKKSKDSRSYWPKVRTLCRKLVAAVSKTSLKPDERLTLSSHLNLASDKQGDASNVRLSKRNVSWVSNTIYSHLRPSLVVCFGLAQKLKNPEFQNWWNGGARHTIRWSTPDSEFEFKWNNKKYKFKVWQTRRPDGKRMVIIIWPNHPSKSPFAGKKTGDAWQASLKQGSRIVRDLNLNDE